MGISMGLSQTGRLPPNLHSLLWSIPDCGIFYSIYVTTRPSTCNIYNIMKFSTPVKNKGLKAEIPGEMASPRLEQGNTTEAWRILWCQR